MIVTGYILQHKMFRTVNFPAASSNQNVTDNILREQSEEWSPGLPGWLKNSNRAKDSLSVCLSVCLCLCVCYCVCLSVSLCLCLSVCLSVCLSLSLSCFINVTECIVYIFRPIPFNLPFRSFSFLIGWGFYGPII